jgi:hypothetical protein
MPLTPYEDYDINLLRQATACSTRYILLEGVAPLVIFFNQIGLQGKTNKINN